MKFICGNNHVRKYVLQYFLKVELYQNEIFCQTSKAVFYNAKGKAKARCALTSGDKNVLYNQKGKTM